MADWRDIGNEGSAPAGNRPWQTGDAPPEVAAPTSRRNFKRGIAVFALVAILVGIGWAVYLLRAAKPSCFIAIGSGYELNLLLPHNAPGWNGLRRLNAEDKSAAKDSMFRPPWAQPIGMRRVRAEVDLDVGSWRDIWEDLRAARQKENTLVLFFSLHGIADDGEPYLLPNVVSLAALQQQRIPFKDILTSLKTVDRKKNVLVLLDVCQFRSHWPTGTLDNDFVTQLQTKYQEEIEGLGNVLVVTSASPGEQAWNSEEFQNSVFTHFVTQGLHGAALRGKTGIVSARKLFDYVAEEVDNWARTNRARGQKPMMLGKTGIAEKIDVVYIDVPAEPYKASEVTFDPGKVEKEWRDWQNLLALPPYIHAPHLWRQYQETLLRYEQIMRCGDPTGKADDLKKLLTRRAQEIRDAHTLDVANECLGYSFPMHQVLGFRSNIDLLDLPEKLDSFRLSVRDDREDKKQQRGKFPKIANNRAPREMEYLQVQLGELLLRGMDEWDNDHASLTELAKELGVLRPVELQLHAMLRFADRRGLKRESIQTAVEVRTLAEQAALNPRPRGEHPYSEVILPRIQKAVTSADKIRREGEDLLFGDPKKHEILAKESLEQARIGYEAARTQAKIWQRALAVRDEALAELPYLASWLALAPAGGETMEKTAAARSELVTLGNDVEKLGTLLGNDIAKEDAKSTESLTEKVKTLSEKVKTMRDKLRNRYRDVCTDLPEVALQKNWHEFDHALSVPLADVDLRLKLLHNVVRKLPEGEGRSEGEESSKERIDRQRKLLTACLAPARPHVGDPILAEKNPRDYYLKMLQKIKEHATDPAEKEATLREAVSLCAMIPAGLAEGVPTDPFHPVERLRRIRMHKLLMWQAERTWQDHWYDKDTPYYLPAARSYVNNAKELIKDDQGCLSLTLAAEDFERRKLVDSQLKIVGGNKTYPWTTELDYALPWEIEEKGKLPSGKPMAWLEVASAGNARHEVLWPSPKSMPPFRSVSEFEVWGGNVLAERANVVLKVLYRGQLLEDTIRFDHPPADLRVLSPAPPKDGSLFVRVDESFNYGAISIVLDTSGSMRWVPHKDGEFPKPGEPSRFDHAMKAMHDVLERIPEGTSLSIVRFGPDENDKNKTGVEFLMSPELWQKSGRPARNLFARLDQMNKNRQEELNFESPIARGIVKSMNQGFPPDYRGPKVILVLSDGGDSDPGVNVAERLQGAGLDSTKNIDVVVVCFIHDTNAEFQKVKDQFAGVRKISEGSRLKIEPEGTKLGQTIVEILQPRLKLNEVRGGKSHAINRIGIHQLEWNKVLPNDYTVEVDHPGSPRFDLTIPRGLNLLVIPKRKDRKFVLERGLLADQMEAKDARVQKRDDWRVSLFHNYRNPRNELEQLILFEKALDPIGNPLQQRYPGFVWLELVPLDQKKKGEGVLQWGFDWSIAAPAYALKMPDWQSERDGSRLTAWFWPREKESLAEKQGLVRTVPVTVGTFFKPAQEELAYVESARWEDGELVIRAVYPLGNPVVVVLKNPSEDVSVVQTFFHTAGRTTARFRGIPKDLKMTEFQFIDVAAFKRDRETQKVEFEGVSRIDMPRSIQRPLSD